MKHRHAGNVPAEVNWFPSPKGGGPIEAASARPVGADPHAQFPSPKGGGPIEAQEQPHAPCRVFGFPSPKGGGPIEACTCCIARPLYPASFHRRKAVEQRQLTLPAEVVDAEQGLPDYEPTPGSSWRRLFCMNAQKCLKFAAGVGEAGKISEARMARLVEVRAAKQRDIYPYKCAILQIWSGGALHHKNGRPYRAGRPGRAFPSLKGGGPIEGPSGSGTSTPTKCVSIAERRWPH